MLTIIKIVKRIICITVFLIGLFTMLKLVLKKLEKMGIVKSMWKIDRTPAGKGVRYSVSLWGKVFFSFQV